jgi:hypothetical protein
MCDCSDSFACGLRNEQARAAIFHLAPNRAVRLEGTRSSRPAHEPPRVYRRLVSLSPTLPPETSFR